MSFSYANPTSGPSAGGIGWFDFNSINLLPNTTLNNLGGTMPDGTEISFSMTLTPVSGQSRSFVGQAVPTFPGAEFGVAGYTGIAGNAAFNSVLQQNSGVSTLTISNIVVKDSLGNPIPQYTVVLADAERTNTGEQWQWVTNGSVWKQLAQLGGNPPTLTGLATPTATITGNALVAAAAFVLYTQTPTQLDLTLTSPIASREAFSLGFALTKVKVQKNVGQRIAPSDQFVLDLLGTPSDQATTTGSADGIQSEHANIYAIPGNTYTINETMAAGSASALTAYKQIISASNTTPAGSIPPIGTLPITFTPILGDDVTYTILNAAPETFKKTVDKAYANVGEILTYTIVVDNPNNFAVNNVLVSDATPAGTTYTGNLVVSLPYTGTSLATGLTITTIPADSSVTISWQVQVNSTPPVSNPIPNYAMVEIPNGTSGMTNVVATQVNTAYVSLNKSVDKAFANLGDILTYSILVNNFGNVSANNITLNDVLPSGTTFVAGSLTGATGTLPNIALIAPLAASASTLVTFQAKVTSLPVSNPITNVATAKYTFTVDPAQLNGVSANATSNDASTMIHHASLSITKSADKTISFLGDTIKYQLAITNTGNAFANNVVVSDLIVSGTNYIPGTLVVSVPFSGTPNTGITLTNPMAPKEVVTISFDAIVNQMPTPNPIVNIANLEYKYTVDPSNPNAIIETAISNPFDTLIFRNNYLQQINDLIESVALQQAALAAIANAEGAKIQKVVSMSTASTQELLCINKSVEAMMASITLLESILKQKMSIVDCQISGNGIC